jgi:DNA-binding MarR family transcriptional regulator
MKSDRMELCNCFAVRQAARHLTRLYEQQMAEANLTSAQFSILVLLDENQGLTMSEVAQAMVMDRTTLLRALKPLQRDGLVTSRRQQEGAGDPRSLVLEMSPSGAKRLKQAMVLWSAAQRKFEASVGAARAARLRHDLNAISRG